MKTNETYGRRQLIDYLHRELIGPVNGPEEVISTTVPMKRYTMGVLFPVASSAEQILEGEEEDARGSAGEEVTDDPVRLSGQWMPSSMGFTFYFSGASAISVNVEGAAYGQPGQDSSIWKRILLTSEPDPETIEFDVPSLKPGEDVWDSVPVLGQRGKIHVHWRRLHEGYLTTVTLMNARTSSDDSYSDPEDCIYQSGITCLLKGGTIREYPDAGSVDLTEKEEELRLLYRHSKTYAIGHGCAASWEEKDGEVVEVSSALIPEFEVQPITHTAAGDPDTLRMSRLADPSEDRDGIITDLNEFVGGYETWIDGLNQENDDIPSSLNGAVERLTGRLREAADRMRQGVKLLSEDETVFRAFQMANRAMLMQMHHGSGSDGRKVRNSFSVHTPDYLSLDAYVWRPFQLAYQLLTLESVTNTSSEYRDVVDLIWFPTGGGKTEAYLAVAAFQIFLRRLLHKNEGAGTTVITRYTLRLLTAQQFQRSARLICACELIRQDHEQEMGDEPITIGLWVGQSLSPNRFSGGPENSPSAKDLYEGLLEDPSPSNPFQLDTCPWCGTEIIPEEYVEEEQAYGVEAKNNSFRMYCPTVECSFHERLPVSVVDEDLYANPPTFVISTVDKFAMLAWKGEAGAFFGGNGFMPPSLIIQDELHLLSGPLGTTTGIYESGIETLMEMKGIRPKIVASTATIRNEGDQVRGLFGNDARLFPPPGLNANNSYFAEVDKGAPGRLYIGVMSSNHRATTSLIRTSAALQQGPLECDLTEAEMDWYWTLVVYHNSLRELGKTLTFARDDIPARTQVIARDDDRRRKLLDLDVMELTSNLSNRDIPDAISRLELPHEEDESVSLVACTNMFSVGIDIKRLGLMLVNGQPKTTSEYIQSSSRVGRDENCPGLVVTHYASSKPRDRSHYESFIPYHSALYKNVEPTSVTPFSLPSRNRSLHAALVILVRHGVGLRGNNDAGRFNRDNPQIRKAIDLLLEAAGRMEPREAEATQKHLKKLVDEWHERASEYDGRLYYRARGKGKASLLRSFGSAGEGWETLYSMRNVDRQCEIEVIGE